MKTYINPENLRANVNLWNVLPFAATACFAFLSLRVDETAIMDYIFNAVKFFVTSQQIFYWTKGA